MYAVLAVVFVAIFAVAMVAVTFHFEAYYQRLRNRKSSSVLAAANQAVFHEGEEAAKQLFHFPRLSFFAAAAYGISTLSKGTWSRDFVAVNRVQQSESSLF